MITKEQSKELQKHIQELVVASIQESWKGAGDPSDIEHFERELELAQIKLDLFIHTLETS